MNINKLKHTLSDNLGREVKLAYYLDSGEIVTIQTRIIAMYPHLFIHHSRVCDMNQDIYYCDLINVKGLL